MPYFYTLKSDHAIESFLFAQIPFNSQSDSSIQEHCCESSDLAALELDYQKLPCYLKSCFDYCSVVSKFEAIEKKKLVRLFLASGLVVEKPGVVMEDSAACMLHKLIGAGFLQEFSRGNFIQPCNLHDSAYNYEAEQQEFVDEATNPPLIALIECKTKDLSSYYFNNLLIQSLFVKARYSDDFVYDHVFLENICKLEYLVVLNLKGQVENLPDEIGDLVNLRYLGLHYTALKELPANIGNLEKLLTLDISYSNIKQLPDEILKIKHLRHLVLHSLSLWPDRFIKVPKGIRTLVDLQTLTGVHSTSEVADELGYLTQLRELNIGCVSEDHAAELFANIMKLENLVSLWLSEDTVFDDMGRNISCFLEWDSFCPPYGLQELCLQGRLVEIPIILPSFENLVTLRLYDSDLRENPSTVLQFLPKLKHLTLWEAYRTKLIGKEFCGEGGFLMLGTLIICSGCLVEWSDIVKGAFPRLKCLEIWGCYNLRFLPEGLQYIYTLQELSFTHLHGDLARRLSGHEITR